jgi:tetratricopeptide (TPR) repeat protein
MKIYLIKAALFACLAFAACKHEPTVAERIKTMEDSLGSASMADSNEQTKELIALYDEAAKADSASNQAATYLYRAANIARNIGEQGLAMDYYDRVYNNYKDFDKRAECLFQKAFTLEEILDTANARVVYEQFLQEYPNHEMADDARFSLMNMGKTPEQLIEEFEAKMKSPEQ